MKRNIFLLFLGFFSINVVAQNSTSSPYSLGGLGDITFRGNAINRFMGGIDVYSDSIHTNLNNPAANADLKLTTFAVGVNYRNTQLTSGATKENNTSAAVDYIAVAIPTKHFGFSFGVLPYSSVGYLLQSIENEDTDSTVLNRYEGDGGVNKAFFSLGFRLFKGLKVGATANYNFGQISTESSRQEQNINFGTFISSQSSLSGLSFQFTGHWNIPIKDKFSIDLYGSLAPQHKIRSLNEQVFFTRSTVNQSIGDFEEVDLEARNLASVDLTIGDKIDIGGGIGKDKKWYLGGQYTQIQSGGYQNDFIQLNNVSYINGSRLAVGGYFLPNYSSITDYWKRIVYRFGARQEVSGVVVNGQSLEETGISFGVSLPLGGFYSGSNVSAFSNMNIGVELGKRGTASGNMIEENYWNIRLGLSLNDLWFIKRKYN